MSGGRCDSILSDANAETKNSKRSCDDAEVETFSLQTD